MNIRLLIILCIITALLALPATASARRPATTAEKAAIARVMSPTLSANVRPCVRYWWVMINTVTPRNRFAYAAPMMKTTSACRIYQANGGYFLHRTYVGRNVWRNMRYSTSGGDSCSDLPRPLTAGVFRDLVGARCL